jgi:hypothetical protein
MKKRNFLFAAVGGLGFGIGIAGWGQRDTLTQLSGDTQSNTDSNRNQKYDIEKRREDLYNQRVENGKQTHGPNMTVMGIDNITDSKISLECNVSINPVDDYEIHLHYNKLTDTDNGDWDLITPLNSITGGYGSSYNSTSEQWEPSPDISHQVPQYVLDSDETGSRLSEETIPSQAYWEPVSTLDMSKLNGIRKDEQQRLKIQPQGIPTLLEFEVDNPPEMYETFVFSITFYDDDTTSSRGGEVIANSEPVIRVAEDEYIYAVRDYNDGGYPSWEDTMMGHDNRNYSVGYVYRNASESTDDGVKFMNTRLSNYGLFNDRFRDFNPDGSSNIEVKSRYGGPEFLDTPIQYPWSITYEITHKERIEVAKVASQNRAETGEGTVKAFIDEPEIMNHDVIQDVASQLGDVCEMMNTESPTEELRVVSDFVQYLAHDWDGREFGEPIPLGTPGTSHPVVTLAREQGDCKDFTVLANSILQQEPFNMDPSAFVIEGIDVYVADSGRQTVGHISTAIPVSDLDGREFANKLSETDRPLGSEPVMSMIDGEPHVYAEMSGPWHMGYVQEEWVQDNPVQSLDNVVD